MSLLNQSLYANFKGAWLRVARKTLSNDSTLPAPIHQGNSRFYLAIDTEDSNGGTLSARKDVLPAVEEAIDLDLQDFRFDRPAGEQQCLQKVLDRIQSVWEPTPPFKAHPEAFATTEFEVCSRCQPLYGHKTHQA